MNARRGLHAWVLLGLGALCSAQALAQTVALSGASNGRALLVVDGTAPKFMSPGQTHRGVKLVSVQDNGATVEIDGKRQSLQVGGAPVSLGGAAPAVGSGRIVLTADTSGHFSPAGQINGKSVQFLVDTGATVVSIGETEAKRLGLKYEQGQRVQLNTANGIAVGYRIRLDTVRIGETLIYDVDGVVTPQSMPFVLLGNSFLNRFQMQRTNDQLTLEKK